MLLTVSGIGPVIAWTIVLEGGNLNRFADVGHFASYCRCIVNAARMLHICGGRQLHTF
jgi:hypothetical protein